MGIDKIIIKGAKEHNLKNIDLEIPRDKLIVFTGVSGSGKSSLAFDTIYADGQRRYVESLSSYARQFLGQMEKPNVEYIEGLSPAISIDQKTTNKNPRSTVGTVTEIYDYLRLLYARVGVPHCTVCGKEISQQTIDQMVDKILSFEHGTKIQLLAPMIRGRKGEHVKLFDSVKKSGFVRVRVDGNVYDVNEEIKLDKNKKHNIEVMIDRLILKEDIKSRLTDSIETALSIGNGIVIVDVIGSEEIVFSQNYACDEHDVNVQELSPRMFSFNNPIGACEKCTGLGTIMKVDKDLVIPNPDLSLNQGAIVASGWKFSDESSIARMYFDALTKKYGFSLDVPIRELDKSVLDLILYGNNNEPLELNHKNGTYKSSFEGIINNLERRYKETQSEYMRDEISAVMSVEVCNKCKGDRLKDISLAVTVSNINISKLSQKNIASLIEFIDSLDLEGKNSLISEPIIKEIKARLGFLKSVGLEYLDLMRSAGTLSGGESQRIRLATQIGSSLVGVLYILDEPSIGLHQKDNDRLIATLKKLRDIGNTVIVVEHDEDTIREADYIVDIGPGAGVHGGTVVCRGSLDEILSCDESKTGQYLSGKKKIEIPKTQREGNGKSIIVKGAKENNLKNINVEIPLGLFTCVTGVSGSGKSTLINEIIYKKLASAINRSKMKSGKHREFLGIENVDKVINIDQSPIGKTPRSNPATYTGVFTDIREIFAQTKDAKIKGYNAGRFSFNTKGGRCEACHGDGVVKIEMHFLPDIFVSCDVCKGKRYDRETLDIYYKGKNIYDVLEMTIEDGAEFFSNIPKASRKLEILKDVGLGYIKIGQQANTLSGGEAQRVKLATELSKRPTGKTIYILDEPTTGLHTADVDNLVKILHQLADSGNTVLVIEHNLDLIKTADYIIDLGPEGGTKGGEIVAKGTPRQVSKNPASYTGKYLSKFF